jgi:hypothetical protein
LSLHQLIDFHFHFRFNTNMGIKDLWQLIKKKKYEAPPLVLPQPHTGTLRIDLQACFFGVLKRAFASPPPYAHNMIHNSLSEVAEQEETVIYIDGFDVEEKADTHADRCAKREVALQQATCDLDKLEGLLTLDKPANKQLHRDIAKNLGKAFHLSFDQRSELAAFLQGQGWSVRLSAAEADIDIAKDCKPEDVVLTTDSDLLVYKNVKTVWRVMGRRKALEYKADEVLSALNLESKNHLTALAITSTNDYSKNIPRLGISTNLKVLQTLHGNSKH